MNYYEKTEKEKLIYKGKIIKVKELDISLPNGKLSKREIVEHPGAVAIIAVTNQGELILIKQFRKACEEILWEIPAGKLEKDEEAIVCAKRELKEETGFEAREWDKIGAFYTSPGFSSEIIHLFLAKDLVSGETDFDEDEYLEQYKVDFKEIRKLISRGEIKDLKTMTALLYLSTKGLYDVY